MDKDNKFEYPLIQKELESTDKIMKPDFNQKTGRELLAFYLQSKFKQILAYDKKYEQPIFISVKPDFISKFSKRLINNPEKRFLVAITGESASGKSTICREIQNVISRLELPVSIVTTDNYFNDISELIKRCGSFDNLRDIGYDVDSPQSFQLDLLKEDLEKISRGENIRCPEYLPNGTGISVPNSIPIESKKIIVVEGMATMYGDVKDVFDLIIYIETDLDIRKKRFMYRAEAERNQDLANAEKHWNYILGAGEKYILPSRSDADIILNGNSSLQYFAQILEYIYTITNNFETN